MNLIFCKSYLLMGKLHRQNSPMRHTRFFRSNIHNNNDCVLLLNVCVYCMSVQETSGCETVSVEKQQSVKVGMQDLLHEQVEVVMPHLCMKFILIFYPAQNIVV